MQVERPPLTTLQEFREVIAACEAGEHVPANEITPEHYRTPEGRLIAANGYRDAVANLEQMEIIERKPAKPEWSTLQEAAEIVAECPRFDVIEPWKGAPYYVTEAGVKYDADDIEYLRELVLLDRAKTELAKDQVSNGTSKNKRKAVEWRDVGAEFIDQSRHDFEAWTAVQDEAFLKLSDWANEKPDERRCPSKRTFTDAFPNPIKKKNRA